MKTARRFFLPILLSLLIFLSTLIGWNKGVQSQDRYPTRAIEVIIPYGPGGSNDLVQRIIAPELSKKWGVPVNVVNKAGGNGVPACLEVHKSTPDGYTILGDSSATTSNMEVSMKNLPFKIMDRTFIARTTQVPVVLFVPSTSPFNTLKDLATWALKNPEEIKWASSEGPPDLCQKMFFKEIGVDISKTKPVISVGGRGVTVLVSGGHVVMGASTVSASLPLIKGGLVKPLLITSENRFPLFPDIPTSKELGYPAINAKHWTALSGPPNMPSHIVEKWDKALQEILKDSEVILKLKNIGQIPFYQNANEIRGYILEETKIIKKILGLET